MYMPVHYKQISNRFKEFYCTLQKCQTTLNNFDYLNALPRKKIYQKDKRRKNKTMVIMCNGSLACEQLSNIKIYILYKYNVSFLPSINTFFKL